MAEDEELLAAKQPTPAASNVAADPLLKQQPPIPAKSYTGLSNALNYLFTGRESTKLVTGLVEDLSSGKSFFSMGFRVLWFGIRHPVHTYNLMQMEKNKDAFNDPAFQKAILENPRTWQFIGTIGEKLPVIGSILSKFGVKEFDEGNILDQKSLGHLSKTLQDARTQTLLQNVALATIEVPLDRDKVILGTLKLMNEGKNVGDFFKEKGEALKDYAVLAMQENKGLEETLKAYGLERKDLKLLAEIVPILLNEPGKLEKIYRQMSEGKTTEMVNSLLDLVDKNTPTGIKIGEYIEANQKLFIGAFNEYAKTNKMATYGLGKDELEKIGGIVPILLDKPAELKKIYNLMSEGKTTEMVNSILDLAETTPKIASYIEANQKLFIGAFNEYAKTNKMNTYGLGHEELEKIGGIVPILLDKPAELKKIYNLMSEGKTTEMVNSILDLAETTPKIREYIKDNQKLFIGAFNEYAKTNKMNTYGLGKDELEKIGGIVPILLDKPAELKKIYNLMSEGKTTEMVNSILELAETTPKIREYIVANQKLFIGAFNEYAKTNKMDTYGLKPEDLDKIANIVPILLDKPAELKKIYAMVNEGNYPGVANLALGLLETTPAIGNYIKENKSLFVSAFSQYAKNDPNLTANLAKYGLNAEDLDKIANIVPILLSKPAELKKIYAMVNEGDYMGIAKAALILAKDTPEIKEYFKNNQQLFTSVLEKVIASSPALEGYNLSGKIYEIVPVLLEHPDKLVKMVQLYEQGKTTEIGKVFLDLAKSDEKIQNYLTQNKVIIKGALNKAGLGGFEVDDKVLDIVDNLVKPQNLEKFPKLIDLYNKGKWNDLVIETCKLIETDPAFSQYLRDNQENFGKIFNAAITKMPEVQKYIGDADVGSLISSVIKDPTSIRQLVEGYDVYEKTGSKTALAMAGATFLKNKAFDSDFRAAAYNAVTGWVFGGGVNKQEVVQKITDELATRDVTQRVNLNEFTKSAVDSAQITDESQKTKLQQAVAQNNLFDGVTFIGKDALLTLANLEINSNKFVGSNFDNVSFKDCKLTNVSFAGAKFSGGVNFNGSEIDGATLQSLLPALKEDTVSLKGAKIVGDLPVGIDLTDVRLVGADLSKVTGMKEANLSGANLRGAILPENKNELLATAHNLKDARLDDGLLTEKMKTAQEKMVISKIVANFKDLTPEQKRALETKLQDLYRNDTEAGKEFRKVIEANPADLTNSKLPLDTSKYSHVADYKGKTANMLDLIYQNRKNPDNIANNITANIIADKVTKELFGEGKNRGQDGIAIRKMVANSVDTIIKANPAITHEAILESDHFKDMVKLIEKDVRAATQYTTLGLVTSGIQLKTGALDEKLTDKVTSYIGDAAKFTKEELVQMHAIAEGVGKNIYGSRAGEVSLIIEGVKDMVYKIKAEHGGADVSALLEKERDKIVGKPAVAGGYLYGSAQPGTGLTAAYQDASTSAKDYTSAGQVTGGIKLTEKTAKNPEMLAQGREEITTAIKSDLTLKLDIPSKGTAKLQKSDAPKAEKPSGLKGMVEGVGPIDHHIVKGHKASQTQTNLPSKQKNQSEISK